MKKPSLIISLGGSLIVPDKVDTAFLSEFRAIILRHARRYSHIIIVSGGGQTARRYQQAASAVVKTPSDDLDWLGIHSSRLNGHLLRTIFRTVAQPEMITNPERMIKSKKKVIIAAGFRPGHSTDYVAALLAKTYGIRHILNLSNIDYIYDKDPRKHKDVTPLKQLTWKQFRKMVGNKWVPGKHVPFDPIAAKLGEELGLTVQVINGANLKNLDALLAGKEGKGSTIIP